MRYVGLVFLGLVLSAGQASAEFLRDGDAVKILKDGKILHIYTRESIYRTSFNVIYKSQYFVCVDDYDWENKKADLRCYGTPDDK